VEEIGEEQRENICEEETIEAVKYSEYLQLQTHWRASSLE
jgi:hypothetical protein